MADHPQTTTEPNQLNGTQKQQPIPKKTRKRVLPNATASATARAEMTIKAIVSSTPKSVSADSFPLYRLFTLDASGSGELYLKITKHKIVNIVTGDFYGSQCTGYLLSL